MSSLYLCGQIHYEGWDFQGIFSTKQKALDACVNPNYFVTRVTLDEEAPEESELFPNEVIWPLRDT